ncbi:MAG: universal stress protein [Rhodomicrobium sp.]
MQIKTILVYLPSVKVAEIVMATVAKIAEPGKVHVIGFHVSQAFPLPTELSVEVSPDVYEQICAANRKNADAVRGAFEQTANVSQLDHEWRYLDVPYTAGEDEILAETHCADLIVCAKPSDETIDAWSEFPETALLHSGRPVLLLPASGKDTSFGRHIVIAWNNTRESARAVFDSLEFLGKAASIRAVTLIENEDQRASAEVAGARLLAALSRHGIPAKFEVSFAGDDGAGEVLLSRLMDEGCDLLVMGGYSHSPLREMIFGGASRVILRETWVPTLVSH